MKESYLKSFFKSFGFVSVLVAIAGIIGVGYVATFNKIGSETMCQVISVSVLTLGGGFALLGLSGLKKEQISFTDFARIVYLIAGAVLGVLCLIGSTKNTVYAIAYFAVAGVMLFEIFFRFVFCHGTNDKSFKYYFGALAGQYNPLLILILGLAIGAGVLVLTKYVDVFAKYVNNISDYKLIVLGMCGAVLLITLLTSSLDKETEATFWDFLLAVFFVAATALALFVCPKGLISVSFQKYSSLFVAVLASALLLRALTYNKGKSYVNSMHKTRTYFKTAFDKYDIVLPITFAVAVIVLIAISIVGANPQEHYKIVYLFVTEKGTKPLDESLQFVYVLIASWLMLVGIFLTFFYRKFTSQDVVRTDKVLPFLLLSSATVVAFEVLNIVVYGADIASMPVIVALAAGGVTLLYAIIVQAIRLRSYNPIAMFATSQAYKSQIAQAQEEEQQQEEEAQPEEEVQEEEEETDPFGLTEEDEAIYEAIYGKQEQEEEHEPVVEAVDPLNPFGDEEVYEEEQPQEEEVVYEEVPAEEAPVEEVSEEEVEEEADDEEEDTEDAEEDEAEESDGEDEEAPAEEAKKESNIVIQEFQVVDENGEPKKIKRKFNTKMMFAPYETKEYYNEIKNYLTMYRAKGRSSARCETFRYKGLVAKVALGGKSIKVFLALDPAIIDENPKYHLKDFSEKKQYQEVPVMIKVRSPRSLKYFKELVDLMMANRGVKPKRNFEPTDYMPQLIPNGEAILASLGMSTYYLQNTMNVRGIPDEMPDDLEDFIPMIAGDPLDDEEVEANVYLDTLCQHFEDGQEVTIDVLKSMHIVTRGNVLNVKARGTLDKKLIIYAEKFESDALKMLMCTNCTAVKIVR